MTHAHCEHCGVCVFTGDEREGLCKVCGDYFYLCSDRFNPNNNDFADYHKVCKLRDELRKVKEEPVWKQKKVDKATSYRF